MSKSFHSDYAESILNFCQGLPDGVAVSTQEVDAYFRACALCLWAGSEKHGGDVIGINQIYTEQQVKFSGEQFARAMSYYRANPTYTTGVPEFYTRIVEHDAKHGTSFSRTFAEVHFGWVDFYLMREF